MTVKMSSEGDSSKNLSSESNEKSEAENSNSSQDSKNVKDVKPDKASENNVSDKEEAGKDKAKEASKEDEKKNDKDKDKDDKKSEDVKNDVKDSLDKKEKEEKAESTKDSKEKDKAKDKKAKEEAANSEDKDDDDDDEDEEEEEEGSDKEDGEKSKPLLDQPLEKSGKRERKNVERFAEDTPAKENAKVEIPTGSGTALGNIPRIDASISRFKNDDMKLLHRILFKVPGKTTMVKKNIKLFCGFDFKKDSDDYNKKIGTMKKTEVKQLKSICEMLDLAKTGSKDDITERILEFLLEPKDSGKPVGGGRPKRTAAVRANNRGYSSHDNYSSDERHSARTARDKGKRANLKEDSSSASDEDFQPSDEGSDEKPRLSKRKRVEKKKVESDEEDVSDVESPSTEESDDEPKSKRKVVKATNNKPKGKGGKRGRPAAAKKPPTRAGKKKNKESSEEEDEEEEESDHKEEEEGSSSEDEPLVKKAKNAQPPTDDEIKTYIKEILEGANLEQITMKTVCQKVYAHYPDFDLAHKKDFIKSTVKSLIST